MTIKEYDNEIKRKAEIYFTNQTEVHITFISGRWARGKITKFEEDHIILAEVIDGVVPIMYEEILGIEPKRQRR